MNPGSSSAGCRQLLDAFELAAERTLTDPLAFPTAPEDDFTEFEVRQFLFRTRHGRKYRVLFAVIEDEVCILHLRGAGQDLLSDLGPIEDD